MIVDKKLFYSDPKKSVIFIRSSSMKGEEEKIKRSNDGIVKGKGEYASKYE